ncbi:MAG: hypothetical protein U0R77_12485 [Mycolicibacterium insubricum]|nr:hypothetical protein [Mycobacterium sp.]
MTRTVLRLAAATAIAMAPAAVAVGLNPAVSNAVPDCGDGWWDPNVGVCRAWSNFNSPPDCGAGNYWDPFGTVCRPIFGG